MQLVHEIKKWGLEKQSQTHCNWDQGPRKEASAPAIIFTTYYAGLEDWVKHFKLLNHADDTSTSHSSQELNTVPNNLDEDTTGIFQFMASNRLVANPSKTKFILPNNKDIETPKQIRVWLWEVESAKLLGIRMDNDQKWTSQFWGKKNLLNALNQRLLATRRISNHIPKD